MHEILMGFSLQYWNSNSIIEGIEQVSAANFPGFESGANLVARYEERIEVFQEILERTDIELIAITNTSNFLLDERMEEEIEIDMNIVRFLHNVGAQFLVVTCGPARPEGNSDEDWSNMLKSLDELGNRALDSSIQLCVMPQTGTIIQTQEDIDRLMVSTEENVVFLCPDLGELRASNVDAPSLVDTYFSRIPYMRFRDVLDKKAIGRPRVISQIKKENRPMLKPVGMTLGTGLSQLQEVWKLLNVREYDGWTMAVVEEPKNDSVRVMKDCVHYLENKFEIIF